MAARTNCLAIDRPDIQYATKNACSKMATPDAEALDDLALLPPLKELSISHVLTIYL